MPATSFTIRELSGGLRSLVLTGRALPYRPLEFSTTMRAEVEWLGGSPEANVQMLGSKDDPTSINGMWKERFLFAVAGVAPAMLDGSPLTTPLALVNTVDSLCRHGQLVEVSWDEHKRVGFIESFRHRWLRSEDVEWDLNFKWIARRGDAPPVAEVASLPSLQEQADIATTRANQTTNDANEMIVSQPQTTLENIGALLTTIQDANRQALICQDAADNLALGNLTWDTGARRVGGSMRELGVVADKAAAIYDTMVVRTADRFGLQLKTSAETRVASLEARRTNHTCALSAYLLRGATDEELLGIYVARQGDDLRDAAFAFYGTPHEWRRLLIHNNLSTTALNAGQEVEIPPLKQV